MKFNTCILIDGLTEIIEQASKLAPSSVQNLNPFRSMKSFSALQCRLECESGYVAQRAPLITCVNGEYAQQGCHYLRESNSLTVSFAFQKLFTNEHSWRRDSCIFPKILGVPLRFFETRESTATSANNDTLSMNPSSRPPLSASRPQP